MAIPQEQDQLLPEPLHSRVLQHSLENLDCELAGQSTDDEECIDGQWVVLPLLYRLHVEPLGNESYDFNIYYLRGWQYGEMIIALAKKDHCPLYKAWQRLMLTRFHVPEAESRIVSRSRPERVDLTISEPRGDEDLLNAFNADAAITLVHDSLNWLSVVRNLKPSDVIVLLTPVVTPTSRDLGDTIDPFECFGHALEIHHNKIRHIPYTTRNGITGTHVGMIREATVVIFVMSDAPQIEDTPQIHAALVTRKALGDERPLLIVLTCQAQNFEQLYENFPTVIQSKDYTKPTLEITATFIFGKDADSTLTSRKIRLPQNPPPKLWPVEHWNESRDIDSVYDLWTQNMDVRFAMHVTTLAALLRRLGFARHYVVRDKSGQLLGFCATFLSYIDQAGEKLVASLAVLLVDIGHQCQGIGLSLHDHAIDQLKKTRGVCRLQLGSTFPRILYGPPFHMEFDQTWFSRRSWRLDREYLGQGQPVYDRMESASPDRKHYVQKLHQ